MPRSRSVVRRQSAQRHIQKYAKAMEKFIDKLVKEKKALLVRGGRSPVRQILKNSRRRRRA